MTKQLHRFELTQEDDHRLAELKKAAMRLVGRAWCPDKRTDPRYLAWSIIKEAIMAIDAIKKNINFYMGCKKPNLRARKVSDFFCNILPGEVEAPSFCSLPVVLMRIMSDIGKVEGYGLDLPLDYLDVDGMPLGILFYAMKQIVKKHAGDIPRELINCVENFRAYMLMMLQFIAIFADRETFEKCCIANKQQFDIDDIRHKIEVLEGYCLSVDNVLKVFKLIEKNCNDKSGKGLHEVTGAEFRKYQRMKQKTLRVKDKDGREGFSSEGKLKQFRALVDKVEEFGGWDKVGDKLGLCASILRKLMAKDGYKSHRSLKTTYERHLKRPRAMCVK